MKLGVSGLLCVVLISVLSGCFSDPYAEQRKKDEKERLDRENARLAFLASIDYQETTFGNLKQDIKSITTDGHGFIVKAYVLHPDWMYFAIGDKPPEDVYKLASFGKLGFTNGIGLGAQNFNSKNPGINQQLESDRQYTVYVAVLKEDDYGRASEEYNGIVTRIEGLRSVEEVTAEREAKRKAEAEAKRLAEEEANKYDASKFTIVPSDFKPANYKKIDLFAAVSDVEKMPRGNGSIGDMFFTTSLYASDVVFVSQSGTDIRFRTDDNAISQTMKVDSRSGLTSNQKVRVYYVVTKNPLTEWQVRAIERL